MIELTNKQCVIINSLAHPVYTVSYIEEWINRNDTVEINAPCALIEMGVSGFFEAVKCLEKVW